MNGSVGFVFNEFWCFARIFWVEQQVWVGWVHSYLGLAPRYVTQGTTPLHLEITSNYGRTGHIQFLKIYFVHK